MRSAFLILFTVLLAHAQSPEKLRAKLETLPPKQRVDFIDSLVMREARVRRESSDEMLALRREVCVQHPEHCIGNLRWLERWRPQSRTELSIQKQWLRDYLLSLEAVNVSLSDLVKKKPSLLSSAVALEIIFEDTKRIPDEMYRMLLDVPPKEKNMRVLLRALSGYIVQKPLDMRLANEISRKALELLVFDPDRESVAPIVLNFAISTALDPGPVREYFEKRMRGGGLSPREAKFACVFSRIDLSHDLCRKPLPAYYPDVELARDLRLAGKPLDALITLLEAKARTMEERSGLSQPLLAINAELMRVYRVMRVYLEIRSEREFLKLKAWYSSEVRGRRIYPLLAENLEAASTLFDSRKTQEQQIQRYRKRLGENSADVDDFIQIVSGK